jgi:hypothetical protein
MNAADLAGLINIRSPGIVSTCFGGTDSGCFLIKTEKVDPNNIT